MNFIRKIIQARGTTADPEAETPAPQPQEADRAEATLVEMPQEVEPEPGPDPWQEPADASLATFDRGAGHGAGGQPQDARTPGSQAEAAPAPLVLSPQSMRPPHPSEPPAPNSVVSISSALSQTRQSQPLQAPAVGSDFAPRAPVQSKAPEIVPAECVPEIEGYLDRINATVGQWGNEPEAAPAGQEAAEPGWPGPAPEARADAPPPEAVQGASADTPPPAILPIGRANRRSGRAKTRLLGFEPMTGLEQDPLAAVQTGVNAPGAEPAGDGDAPTAPPVRFPVGWLVVQDGPGRGHAYALQNGVSQIGRGADQAVRLDLGDTSISRSNHAAIAYDTLQNRFFLGHGGKANLVRLNGGPLLSTEEIRHGDTIDIGETRLRFIALCGADFTWETMDAAS